MNLTWEMVCGEFEFDGSWRDIYVLETSIADWQSALAALRDSAFDLRYSVAGETAPLPPEASAAFPMKGMGDRLLQVKAGGVTLNCHFFLDEQIEFDLDPRQVAGQTDLDAILTFMNVLADACRKPAVLTPENLEDRPILKVVSGSAPEYVRDPG